MQCQTSQNLRPDQVDSIKQLQGKTCTMVACVPGRLFFSSTREKGAKRDDRWIYSNLSGILSLTIDRREHAWVIRLFSTESLELGQLFECELYANLQDSLLRLSPTFMAFQMIDGFIGIQFLTQNDADIMMKALNKSCERINEEEKADFIARLQTEQAAVLGVKKEATTTKKKQKKKKGGFGGWLKRVFGGGKSKKGAAGEEDGPRMGETDDAKYEISLPRAFEKTSHIGWDPKKNTFIMDQVPDDVKSLLRKHKIKKKYLKDQKLAPAIFDILTNPNAMRSSGAYLTHMGQKEETKREKPLFSPEIEKMKVEDKGHIVGEATPAIPAIPAVPVSQTTSHPTETEKDEAENSKEESKEEGSAIPVILGSVIPQIGGGSSLPIPPPPPPPPPMAAEKPLTLIEQLKQMKMQKSKGAGRGDKLDLKKMTEQEENTLMNNLQSMIMQRRSAIRESEFDESASEDEESDWSEEDYD